jgi:hypothetical protein
MISLCDVCALFHSLVSEKVWKFQLYHALECLISTFVSLRMSLLYQVMFTMHKASANRYLCTTDSCAAILACTLHAQLSVLRL